MIMLLLGGVSSTEVVIIIALIIIGIIGIGFTINKSGSSTSPMQIFLNILWHIPFCGFITAIFMALSGLLFCLTIIFIPIGLGFFQISKFLFWPHGNAMVNKGDLGLLNEREQSQFWKVWCIVNRILYFIPGLLTVISTALFAFAEFISLIGIPCGLVWFKILGAIFNPCDKICVPESVSKEIDKVKYENSLREYSSQANTTIPGQPSPEPPVTLVSSPIMQEVVANSESISEYTTAESSEENIKNEIQPTQTGEEESDTSKESNNNIKLLLIIGISLILLIGGVVGYKFLYTPYEKDKNAPRYYTFSDITNLRSSQMTDTDSGIIEKLPYGTELITYKYDSEWSSVKLKSGKKEITGFIASPYILSKEDFFRLNSAFGNDESKESINTAKCRLALLDYLKRNHFNQKTNELPENNEYNTEWQIYSMPENVKPNTVFYPRLFDRNSKFTDFAAIIKNNHTGERRLFIYSFLENETPVFQYEENAPRSGEIKNIQARKNGKKFQIITYYTEE